MLKTYISLIGSYFATDIIGSEGKPIARIAFDGGIRYPEPRNGIFVTNDPDLQKAIEKDKSFGVQFKLLRTEGTEPIAKPVVDPFAFPDIVTVGAARIFLKDSYKKDAMNRAEVFAAAAELGITFPNLPVE